MFYREKSYWYGCLRGTPLFLENYYS